MDTVKAVRTYLTRLITEVTGIKVLLLDAHTTPIVSLAMTQTELLAHEVYLTDRIDNHTRQQMTHLHCIAFLRPTRANIAHVCAELARPRYRSYSLYFSNVLAKQQIEDMAAADEFEVVNEVQSPSSSAQARENLGGGRDDRPLRGRHAPPESQSSEARLSARAAGYESKGPPRAA
ncbi:hypothetical protein QFC19_008986 [Naganishia cerealis]|uniref:Uncharacterized protein n=1 Tax=Naganishia cerealis TaxID=610337 RepID=A0ACC2UYE9_9TREE|nr:hypothetical protein QFC19_008986 [Naganishia cerealis]